MKPIPDKITRLAFELNPNEALTEEQLGICEEWTSGMGEDYIKVSSVDPRLLEYAGLYDKLENNKATIWNQIQNNKCNRY